MTIEEFYKTVKKIMELKNIPNDATIDYIDIGVGTDIQVNYNEENNSVRIFE